MAADGARRAHRAVSGAAGVAGAGADGPDADLNAFQHAGGAREVALRVDTRRHDVLPVLRLGGADHPVGCGAGGADAHVLYRGGIFFGAAGGAQKHEYPGGRGVIEVALCLGKEDVLLEFDIHVFHGAVADDGGQRSAADVALKHQVQISDAGLFKVYVRADPVEEGHRRLARLGLHDGDGVAAPVEYAVKGADGGVVGVEAGLQLARVYRDVLGQDEGLAVGLFIAVAVTRGEQLHKPLGGRYLNSVSAGGEGRDCDQREQQ